MDQIFQVKSTSSACMHARTHTAEKESCPLCSVNTWATSAVLFVLTGVSIRSWPWLEGQWGSSVPFLSGPLTHTKTQTHLLTHSIMLFYPHAARQVTLLLM